MSNKKILDVTKVGFHGNTGDNRAPEDFPFPACMASLMEFLGEDYPVLELEAHHQQYTLRTGNIQFIAASGMAFGLLWSKDHCKSCMDLTQINNHDETIKNAFSWAGYEYEIVEKLEDHSNRDEIKDKIIKSIDSGLPVLAFGIVGPPECLIITGYDEMGDTLIGWSHFQNWVPCEKEENEMFRRSDWYDDLWKIVIVKEKVNRNATIKDVLALGLSIMEKNECNGYVAGLSAYDHWIEYVLDNKIQDMDDKTLQATHDLHHILVGNHAEARCWGGDFLLRLGEQDRDENIKAIGQCFKDIHDKCWQVWGALGEYGQKDVWKGFRNIESRQKIAALLKDIKELDQKAIDYLKIASL